MKPSELVGQFIEGPKGPIFLLLRRPVGKPTGCVLVVPPFAEEMNKCRRMVAEASVLLAQRGVATLIPDLYGTGDSGGDFEDADWATWQGDLQCAVRWAKDSDSPVDRLLAVRFGAALAASFVAGGNGPPLLRTVFWQPEFDGTRHLMQFLRLRVAASLAEDKRESVAELVARLRNGEALEVAGYRVSGRLAADLERVPESFIWGGYLGSIAWMEIVREAGLPLTARSTAMIDRVRDQAGAIAVHSMVGEPYWSSTEIVVNQDVILATADLLCAPVNDAERIVSA